MASGVRSQSIPAECSSRTHYDLTPEEAESLLADLASTFFITSTPHEETSHAGDDQLPRVNAVYRALVEQIPAILFMAHLEKGVGEAYVSPQIETSLGFSQAEWLEDPIRWYQQIHPEDKQRWSTEAARMFISGQPLRSAYRVIARDGRVVWFHCEAKMIRREDGRPWFIHGVAFDITELKQAEEALQQERNVLSAILDTVGALVVVLDTEGRIVRFNRASEESTGYDFDEVKGKHLWNLCALPEESERFRIVMEQLRNEPLAKDYEISWTGKSGLRRIISWSSTTLPGSDGNPAYLIATGIDVTERKRLEKAIIEVSAEEHRRIGRDLHDDLGQLLTGIAFMSKVQEQKLADKNLPEAESAARIVGLVNAAIHKTRELSHGLLPVVSDAQGLMSALHRLASEVEELFRISCLCRVYPPVLIRDPHVSTHLYHIAQEAVNNAIKHGQAKNIFISLALDNGNGCLRIEDDGSGIPSLSRDYAGMGLQIMQYRARIITGSLNVTRGSMGGTLVVCNFPMTNL